MKKNYIIPMARVIDVDTESLICLSAGGPADDSEVLVKERNRYGNYEDFEDFEDEDYEEDLW